MMPETPLQSVANDREVMDEIRERFGSGELELPERARANTDAERVLRLAETRRVSGPKVSMAALGLESSDHVAEAIIYSVGRPSLLIQDGVFHEPDLEVWRKRLKPVRKLIEERIPSVGRVELVGHPSYDWVGTAWLLDDDILVTNRHVAEIFAERRQGGLGFVRNPFGQPVEARVDFREEFDRHDISEILIREILFVSPRGQAHPDVAFLRIDRSADLPSPIPLAAGEPEDGQLVGTIGYPSWDSRNPDADMRSIFRDIFDVKRFAPGYVSAVNGGFDFQHNCSTLAGASGSPLLDLATGEAVGLHFGGSYRVANYAVRISTVKKTLARGGFVAVPGDEREPASIAADYGDREGYSEDFLGDGLHVPLPDLRPKQRAQALVVDARLRGIARYTLDYTHFSIIMNAERRLAFYTAVNIDGSQEVVVRRADDSWMVDPRIPADAQTANALYHSNRIDRGHLVRRLDPVWGTDEEAKRANADTFHYTNAAPQHERLNQRTWLHLEDYLLQNANRRDLKLSVFTGPRFADDDPEYRGVGIPQEYWKVVVMANGQSLHATGYLLSQKRFLDDLEFVFGAFRTYQVPIRTLEELTGIDFRSLADHDPLGAIESLPFQVIDGPEDLVL